MLRRTMPEILERSNPGDYYDGLEFWGFVTEDILRFATGSVFDFFDQWNILS